MYIRYSRVDMKIRSKNKDSFVFCRLKNPNPKQKQETRILKYRNLMLNEEESTFLNLVHLRNFFTFPSPFPHVPIRSRSSRPSMTVPNDLDPYSQLKKLIFLNIAMSTSSSIKKFFVFFNFWHVVVNTSEHVILFLKYIAKTSNISQL